MDKKNATITKEEEKLIKDVIDFLLSFTPAPSELRFKQSSTAFLAITFIVFFAYSVLKFYKQRKNNFALDVS
jgi:flagellar biogenesis protein FliO